MTDMRTRLANRAPLDLANLDEAALMGCVDHSILRPELTRPEVEREIELALEWRTVTVCCRPADLEFVVRRLRGTGVAPATVIGFPHGTQTPEIKEREALQAVDRGAAELDLVINIGALRGGDVRYVRDELAGICYAVAPTPVKVILETAHLSQEQVIAGCRLVVEARGAFVKTGTGFAGRYAEPPEVALMRRTVGDGVGVAAEGVRTLDALLSTLADGACRVATTATAAIGAEWRTRGPEAAAAAIAPRSAGVPGRRTGRR
jgi:deoxyribose-phosphate aldolase